MKNSPNLDQFHCQICFDFHTQKFWSEIAGQNMFGDWHMDLIVDGRLDLGLHITPIMSRIEYNVRYKNNYNVDLKFSKFFH